MNDEELTKILDEMIEKVKREGPYANLGLWEVTQVLDWAKQLKAQRDIASQALSDARHLVNTMLVAGRVWPPDVAKAWQQAQASINQIMWIPAVQE